MGTATDAGVGGLREGERRGFHMVLFDKRKITAIMALLAACTFCVAGCHKSQDNGASGESVKEAVSDMGQAGSGQEGTQQESTEQEEDVVYQPSFKEWEEQAQTFYDILASAQVPKGFSTDIYNIIYEEAQAYFAGTKTARDVAEIIQDGVQIYVDERK